MILREFRKQHIVLIKSIKFSKLLQYQYQDDKVRLRIRIYIGDKFEIIMPFIFPLYRIISFHIKINHLDKFAIKKVTT